MSTLLDFLQAASNTVAGNVSGPVDLITLGLRKAGVPVPENSLGSSQWMREKGLLRDVPMGPARLAGETFGLLGPTLATQYAPQIARGMLAAQENAAAPRAAGPMAAQRGAIVWHGSPHKFDKFDSSKIGTGEGAQAYGHGLYLADSPGVAKSYADKLGAIPDPTIRVDPGLSNKAATFASNALKLHGFDPQKASAALYRSKQMMGADDAKRAANEAISAIKHGRVRAIVERDYPEGNLYKVDLPDSAIARMLDWDAPLSQQAHVIDALSNRFGNVDSYLSRFNATRSSSGGDLVKQPTAGQMIAATKQLHSLGIPGIRYLDGGSRAAGQGTRNYVVFPGEESLLKILERNGVPLGQ